MLDGGGQTGAKGSISYLSNSVWSSLLSLVACFMCLPVGVRASLRRRRYLARIFSGSFRHFFAFVFRFCLACCGGVWERRERRKYIPPLFWHVTGPPFFSFFVPARLRDSAKVDGITARAVATNIQEN
ncbi:unnamed protein product [Ectocarpus sp. 12 AP-2014]